MAEFQPGDKVKIVPQGSFATQYALYMGRTGEVEEAVGDDMLGLFKDLPEGTRGGYAIVLEPDGEYSVFPEEWLAHAW